MIDALIAVGGTPEQIRAVVAAAEAQAAAETTAAVEADELRRASKREVNADRQRRHRERNASSRVTSVVTRDDAVTGRDESVTQRDPSPPPSPSPEPPTPPAPTPGYNPRQPSAVAPKGAAGQRGSTLPQDWQPKPRHFDKAASIGLSSQWVRDRAEAMREWAGANRNRQIARKADWDLTFDGFIRRDAHKATGAKPGSPMLFGSATDFKNDPIVELGGGLRWPESRVVAQVAEYRANPRSWLEMIGPPPGQPGCRIPQRLIDQARAA